jgi:hypothetical protein
MRASRVWRFASIILGLVTALLGMYGAYQFGLRLEGRVSYLTIAAPVIAGAAALIPPFAEQAWRSKQYPKSLLWWAVLIPAAAGAEAERSALRKAAGRAGQELSEAKHEAAKAEAEARRAETRKTCGATCREARQARDEAHVRLEKAEQALFTAEAKATTDSDLVAPEWLLPAALDLIAFMAIWTGLTGPRAQPEPKARRRRKIKARAKDKPQPLRRPTDLDHLRVVQ